MTNNEAMEAASAEWYVKTMNESVTMSSMWNDAWQASRLHTLTKDPIIGSLIASAKRVRYFEEALTIPSFFESSRKSFLSRSAPSTIALMSSAKISGVTSGVGFLFIHSSLLQYTNTDSTCQVILKGRNDH